MATDTLPDLPQALSSGDVDLSSLEATIDARLQRIARHERAMGALRWCLAMAVLLAVLVPALAAIA